MKGTTAESTCKDQFGKSICKDLQNLEGGASYLHDALIHIQFKANSQTVKKIIEMKKLKLADSLVATDFYKTTKNYSFFPSEIIQRGKSTLYSFEGKTAPWVSRAYIFLLVDTNTYDTFYYIQEFYLED